MTHAYGLSQFEQRDHSRVASSAFETTEVLLAKARALFDLLLGEPFHPTQPGEVPANKFAHVHAHTDRSLHTLSL